MRRRPLVACALGLALVASSAPANAVRLRAPSIAGLSSQAMRAFGTLPRDRDALAARKAEAGRRAPRKTEQDGGEPSAQSHASPSWEGLNDLSLSPSDSTGAIGPTRYVEMINSKIGIYDRSGALQGSATLNTLTGSNADIICDPQVIWDPDTSRFYVGALDCSATGNSLFYGFSKTSSPNTHTDFCMFTLDYGYGTAFPDYPKMGDTRNFVMFGVNVFDGNAYEGADLVWVKKPADGATCPAGNTLVKGQKRNLLEPDNDQAFTPVPANQIDGSTTGHIVAAEDTYSAGCDCYVPADELITWTVTDTGSTLSLAQKGTSIPVTTYEVPPGAPQQDSTKLLDTSDARLTQAVSATDPSKGRVGVWTQHTVDGGGGAVVRWYEAGSAPATILRSGTVSDPSLYVFNGAISPDRVNSGSEQAFGDSMVLGYNTSSATTNVAIRSLSQVRRAVPVSELIVQSPGGNRDFTCDTPFEPVCRWGDYAAATPDPAASVDGPHGRVWLTNMWNVDSATNVDVDWRTWIWAVQPRLPFTLQSGDPVNRARTRAQPTPF